MKFHRLDRSANRQIYPNAVQSSVRLKFQTREEGIDLIKGESSFSDLKRGLHIRHRPPEHGNSPQRLRMLRRPIVMECSFESDVVEPRAVKMRMLAYLHPDIEKKRRQFPLAVGDRRNRNQRVVDIDLGR